MNLVPGALSILVLKYLKMETNPPFYYWRPVTLLIIAKFGFHLAFLSRYGFQRDELLYQALGDHPAFGYWSNPPLIGWISWLTQHTLGDALWATRIPALLAGCGVLAVAVLIAREFGGGKYAQILTGFGVLVSPAYLRSSHLFQPVVFDILLWSLMSLFFVRYLRRGERRDILWFGLTFGLGFLNKYSVGFLLIALVPVLLFSSRRRVLWSKAAGEAALIALILILPNLIWQYSHDFPVWTHMQELAAYQLGNVTLTGFVLDQLLMNFPGLILWLGGLGWLLFNERAALFRPAAGLFISVILIFILFSGKSYYTLGIYPMLLAAGGVAWASWIKILAGRIFLPLAMLLLLLPILPLGVPVLKMDRLTSYCRYLIDIGLDAPMRWENGRVYPLPQDYADMLGWTEIARLAAEAEDLTAAGEAVVIYGDNYGQAAAVDHYGSQWDLPRAISFADTYRLWLPEKLNAQTLIYINDELGPDLVELFEDIRLVGQVENPLARERGTGVYLCRNPRRDLQVFWDERVAMVPGARSSP